MTQEELLGDIKSSARAHVDSLMLNACSGPARKAYCLQMCQLCQIQYLHWATVTINTRNITDYSHHIYFHTSHMTHVAVSGMSLGCIWCVSGVYLVCLWGVSWGAGEFVSCTASSLLVMAKIRRIDQPPFLIDPVQPGLFYKQLRH